MSYPKIKQLKKMKMCYLTNWESRGDTAVWLKVTHGVAVKLLWATVSWKLN